MRIAIVGNSGSGKSTLARRLSRDGAVPVLDLDTIAWMPGQIAVPRPMGDAQADLRRFCDGHPDWIVEGCYGDLIGFALAWRPELRFVNPGEEVCLAHCRARPHEPHKYRSKAEQDERLPFLLAWVSDYYRREGPLSLAGHRALYDGYDGPKQELRTA